MKAMSAGFEEFFDRFRKGLPIEHVAIESIPLETKLNKYFKNLFQFERNDYGYFG